MKKRLWRTPMQLVSASLFLVSGLCPLAFGDGLPLAQISQPDFVGSADCAFCHATSIDATGQDVSIDTHWRSTMMANSAKDPLWQAKVSSEIQRAPALKSVIEDKCSTCHMPMARTQAKALGSPVAIFGDGFLNENNPFHTLAMDGVSCSLCHQISDQGLGDTSSLSGKYHVDTSTESPNRLIYGPFPNPFLNQMRNIVGYTPIEGAHTTKSELCAFCHHLETPYVDGSGTVLGTFPEQMTYMEWEHSQFNGSEAERRECQDCHMPDANGGVVLSNRGRGLTLQARSPYAQHHFVGGNEFMLKLLSDNLDTLKLTASSQQIEDTRVRLISQMQSATANVSVTGIQASETNLEIGLKVSSLVGHKFPSGFPSRRAWIHLTVKDSKGQVVFESGRPDESGKIVGNDADFVSGTCEPHYQIISKPEQVQIYESVMENTDGEITYTLLRGANYRKDNRLLPKGFDQSTADNRIAVFGEASGDTDFTGGQDEILYRIPIDKDNGSLVIDVNLYYQTVSAAFLMDLQLDDTTQVSQFSSMYETADKAPVTVASMSLSVESTSNYNLSVQPWNDPNGPNLSVDGPIGGIVDLEVSADLENWELLQTIQQTNDPSVYKDPLFGSTASRYYRLTWPLEIEEHYSLD